MTYTLYGYNIAMIIFEDGGGLLVEADRDALFTVLDTMGQWQVGIL